MDLVSLVKSYIVGDQRCAACYMDEFGKLRTCGLFAWHDFVCAGRCARVFAPGVCVVHLDTSICGSCWRFAEHLDDEHWERLVGEADPWWDKEDANDIRLLETSVASAHQQRA